VNWQVKEMTYSSNGFFKRLYSCFEAHFNQKDINHVTGDIHFIVLFLRRKKTILTIHDVGLLNHPNPIIRSLLKLFWVTLPVKRSAIVTTVSLATKQELLKHVHGSAEKIRVVYNPVSSRFQYTPKAFNQDEPCILQIGTKYNKNVERLVTALTGIPCRLEIIGKVGEALQRVLMHSKIPHRVSENLTDEEIVEKYSQADIVAFVSTFEGFGMPIIEGNAIGRVVITSNVSSMPEIAGEAACLVDPFDIDSIRNAFKRVISDDTYRSFLIAKGRDNVKRFDAKRIASEYSVLYRTLDFYN
jgi:glycosyltransferase involved in cell wall biosynthesis